MLTLRNHVAFLAALLVAGPVSAGPLAAQDAETFRLSGNRVAVYNLAGSISVVGAAGGGDVVVEVTRGGGDEERLRIDRRQARDRAALVVVYPGDRVVYRGGRWSGNTTLRVRDDGTFSDGGSHSGRRVRISSSGNGVQAHADLNVRVPAGRSVALYLGVGSVDVRNVDGEILVDVASASVTTSDTRGRLDIDTGSGSVRVRNADGDLRVDTGSGSVNLADVRGAEALIDTGSGSVTGSGIRAGLLNIDTGSGRIDVSGVTASDVRLDTGSGGVRLTLDAPPQRVRIDTGSGSVSVLVPQEVNAALEIETGSGGISVDVPVRVLRSQRGRFSGVLGSGGGRIDIDTGSGGVRVGGR